MKKILMSARNLLVALAFFASPVLADGIDNPGGSGGGSATSITIGTTTITSGTDGRILFDNAGVLGEKQVTGTGLVVLQTSPSLITPALGVATGTSLALNGVALGTNTFAAGGTGLFNLNAAAAPTGATGTGVQLVGTDATVARYEADSFGAIAAFTARRANGTGASPTALASSDQIGAFNFHGYFVTGGPGYSSVQATVSANATQNWTSTNQGTQILLRTTPNNSTTLTTAVTIDQDQSVAMAGRSTIATSLAIGGATIGSNALAVTGTANISSTVTVNSGSAAGLRFGATTIDGVSGGGIFNTNNGAVAFGQDAGSGVFGAVTGSGFVAPAGRYYGFASSTINTIDTNISRNAAGVSQFGTTAANAAGAWLAAKGTLTGGTLADQAQVLNITATQPASPTGTQNAISTTITSAGSANQTNTAFNLTYAAGYTGANYSVGASVTSAVAGTGVGGMNGNAANYAVFGTSSATTVGHNVGTAGYANGGNVNFGLAGYSIIGKNSAVNVGVMGNGANNGSSPVQIGGYFTLNQSVSNVNVSAALIADNGAQTDAIFLARDNGVTVLSVPNGGTVISTPSGVVINGHITDQSGTAAPYFLSVDGAAFAGWAAASYGNNAFGAEFQFFKTRATSTAATTIVQSGDRVFEFGGYGADGSAYRKAGGIRLMVDGTPGASDMPGRWEFLTTPDGSATPTLALTINNAQHLILAAPSSDATKTTATLCRDTTSGEIYVGSGTIGICLGTSSARYKNRITDAKEGLAEIAQLEPKRFWYNKNAGDNGAKEQVGFLAEDVVKVFPGLVGLDKEGRPNTIDLVGMIPTIVRSIQELKADNDNLRATITRRAANGG